MFDIADFAGLAIRLASVIFGSIRTAEKTTEGSESKENFAALMTKKIIMENGLSSELLKIFSQNQTDIIIHLLIKSVVTVLNQQIGSNWFDCLTNIDPGNHSK